MIAEESAKWAAEFSKCQTRREFETILRRLAESEMIPLEQIKEPYDRIAEKFGLAEGTDVRESFEGALARVHRIYG